MRRLWSLMPQGGSLPEDIWGNRHRFLCGLTWFHAAIIAIVGAVLGYSWELSLDAPFRDRTVAHTILEGLIVAIFAAAASWKGRGRIFRATAVGFGLMTSSAILVHLSGGYIELHFHFFVMLAFLALYQDWIPYLLSIVYVAIHHGVVGVLEPSDVYNHPAAINAPWTWAGIHAFFVLWASVGSIMAWRFSEKNLAERKQAEEEIRKLNAKLEERVIERTSQLEAANKELQAFSYSVAHDLIAPLRSIDGFNQAVLEDYGDKLDTQAKDYLMRARGASQRMGQLIDDLLSLFRLTRTEMRPEKVDLSELAQSIAAELRHTLPDRVVRFVIAEELSVNGDRGLLRLALENLLGNAWKFTAKKPCATIEFGAKGDNGTRTYFVRDDGAGFDMAYVDKLFAPFQRLHGATEFQGTGIGLATVQRIICRHGGRVWAEGEVERGATFYFTI
jgi:signal transduction histidine kinase